MKEIVMQFIKRLLVMASCLSILLFLMSFLFMFEGLAYEDSLVDGYVVEAGEEKNDAALYGGNEVVPRMVFAYGWNEDFIIAKRHPTLDGRTIDLYTTCWYLIEVQGGKVHGPLTEPQFAELRSELGVPVELKFTKRIQPD